MTMQPLHVTIPVTIDWLTENRGTSADTLRQQADNIAARTASRYELQTEEVLPAGTTIDGTGWDPNPDVYRLVKFTYLAEPHDSNKTHHG